MHLGAIYLNRKRGAPAGSLEAQPPAISLEAPGEFREVVKAAETTYGIKITFLAKLRGGKSGAILYLAELRHKESARVEHFVLKLDEIDKEGRFPEAELHELARREAASFAKHIPEVPFKPIEIDGRILMFYGIAGLSLENFRPLSAYVESSQGQLDHLYGEVFQRLLSEWNLKPVIETTHPQTILEAWLGDCISEEGSAEAFAENTYKIGRDTEAIVIESQVIPNPLVYARRPQKWGETRKLSVLSGLVHGDLNTGNVLVNLTHDGILKDYFVIDFSHYSSRSFLLFDQAYLEFSYLIEHASALSEQKWLALIIALSHDNIPDPKEVPSEAAGLVSVVAQARIAFE